MACVHVLFKVATDGHQVLATLKITSLANRGMQWLALITTTRRESAAAASLQLECQAGILGLPGVLGSTPGRLCSIRPQP